jgi:hypothetical protein
MQEAARHQRVDDFFNVLFHRDAAACDVELRI